MANVNTTPFMAAELNKLCGASHSVIGAYVTKSGEEIYTSFMVNCDNGDTRLIVFLNDGEDETVNTNYLLKAKPLSIKNASTRFLTSAQMLMKWVDNLMTTGKMSTNDVLFDEDDSSRIVGLHAGAIRALFLSRVDAPAKGRSSNQNILVLDFGKGKRATAVKSAIAALLSANGFDAVTMDAKEYATKRKEARTAKAAAKAA